MSERGRHARRSGLGFYRDLLLLGGGILVVGAVVFGALSWWGGGAETDDTTTTPSATDVGPTATNSSPTSSSSLTASSLTSATTSPLSTATSAGDTTSTSATTPPTTIRAAREASQVRVVVLNSTGVTGLAADLTDELAPLGYQLSEPSNYSPELSDTMIFHADDFAIEAVQLAESVPDASVASDQELAAAWGVDLVVVLGRSYLE